MGKGLQNIQFVVGERGLTFLAGFPIISQFVKSLQLKRYFQSYIQLSHRNTYYHWADLLISHFYFTIAGIERLNHLTSMKYNGLIPELTGMKGFPGTRAMRDFLLKMNEEDLEQIEKAHNIIRRKMFVYPKRVSTIILDFDSSVLTVYGNQELAEIGYNPYKHGRRSYHPVFVFESQLRTTLGGELRGGKEKNKGIVVIPFIEDALKKIPTSIAKSRVRTRMDAGFYCWGTVEFIDGRGYGFVIVAQMTLPIKMKLPGLRYRIFNHQERLAVAEFYYQPHGWKKKYRFIVVRHTLPPEPETTQLKLFTLDRYQYHVLVTNLELSPEGVWYFYNGRAAAENYIKELKTDFFMSKIPTRSFLANQVHLKLLLLDYDLFRWFQMLCLPEDIQTKTLQWVRKHILVAPGRFITPGHQNVLKLQKGFPNEQWIKQIYRNAQKVKSLLK